MRASAPLGAGPPVAKSEGACKPSSVPRDSEARGGGHLSGRAVADALLRRNPGNGPDTLDSPYFALLRMGLA